MPREKASLERRVDEPNEKMASLRASKRQRGPAAPTETRPVEIKWRKVRSLLGVSEAALEEHGCTAAYSGRHRYRPLGTTEQHSTQTYVGPTRRADPQERLQQHVRAVARRLSNRHVDPHPHSAITQPQPHPLTPLRRGGCVMRANSSASTAMYLPATPVSSRLPLIRCLLLSAASSPSRPPPRPPPSPPPRPPPPPLSPPPPSPPPSTPLLLHHLHTPP